MFFITFRGIIKTIANERMKAMPNKRDSLIEELILQISTGDMSALGELYELIKTDVFAYALSKAFSVQDAEDITHDTFVQIYKYSKRYIQKGKPLAWIFTIELNLVRRQYNLSKRVIALDEEIKTKSSENDFSTQIVDNQFLCQIMRTLSKEEQEIITLHVVSGLKHREIAKLIQKPLSTVLSKYNRAIKKLQSNAKEEKNERKRYEKENQAGI